MTGQMGETDQFVYIKDLGTHKVAVMQPLFFQYGSGWATTNKFRLDEKNLRSRITNRKKAGLPVDQSKIALVMLLKRKGG